jgi:hypothetical protein
MASSQTTQLSKSLVSDKFSFHIKNAYNFRYLINAIKRVSEVITFEILPEKVILFFENPQRPALGKVIIHEFSSLIFNNEFSIKRFSVDSEISRKSPIKLEKEMILRSHTILIILKYF